MFHFSIISICDVYSFHSKGDSAQLNVHAFHPSTMFIVDMKLGGKHFVFVLFCCFFWSISHGEMSSAAKIKLLILDFGFFVFPIQ